MSDINSGLLNDVLIVGNELSGKLNEIGISNTFGKASEGKDDLISLIRMAIDGIDMAVDTNSYVSLTATNPYMLTGETTDVVAKLRNGVCRPLTNKNVTIGQSVFIDDGTTASHNDNWNGLQYMTRTDTGTIINNTSGSALFDAVNLNNSTIPFANESMVVEFEIVENPSSSNKFRFGGQNLCDGETFRQYDFSFAQGETGRFKFVYDKANNTIAKYKNGAYVETVTHHFCGKMGFLFKLDNGASIKIKDFVVYETINGVTDEKGEFALHDVSVTDDTAFIATYETETATTDVYLCQFVDYGVTGKSRLSYWYYNPTYSSATVDENGTTFISVSEGSFATVSATLTQNPTITDIYSYSFPLTVEFDILGWEDNQGATSDYARIRVYNSANNKIAYWNITDYGVGHYKIVCTEGSQKLYFNGVEQSRKFTFTPTTAWNVAFQTKGHIKYKNFRIK